MGTFILNFKEIISPIDYPTMAWAFWDEVIPSVNKVCCCMGLRTGALFIAIIQTAMGLICIPSFAIFENGTFLTILLPILIAPSGGCLLYAAIVNRRVGPLLYLVLTQIGVIIAAIAGITMPILEEVLGGFRTVYTVLYFFYVPILMYFWVCGHSFYSSFQN